MLQSNSVATEDSSSREAFKSVWFKVLTLVWSRSLVRVESSLSPDNGSERPHKMFHPGLDPWFKITWSVAKSPRATLIFNQSINLD
ncbi:hypothetical protein TNCV_4630701 [Trichonephila clavipes]|nr:hypothetical protein TNCV_4630701 [Trichonephila clavipes]